MVAAAASPPGPDWLISVMALCIVVDQSKPGVKPDTMSFLLHSFAGFFVLHAIAWLFSENRRVVAWRPVLAGMAPGRREDIVRLGTKTLVTGTLATLIAGSMFRLSVQYLRQVTGAAKILRTAVGCRAESCGRWAGRVKRDALSASACEAGTDRRTPTCCIRSRIGLVFMSFFPSAVLPVTMFFAAMTFAREPAQMNSYLPRGPANG